MARATLEKGEDLSEFLNKYQPSITKGVSWIQLNSLIYHQEEFPDTYMIEQKGKHLLGINEEKVREYRKDIDELARNAHCLTGKWMFKYLEKDVDECWFCISNNVHSGSFGPNITAKVSTHRTNEAMGEDCFTIALYNENYQNEKQVFEIREKIRKIGVDKKCCQTLYYKPDIFTYLGTVGTRLRGATYIYIDPE